MVLRSEHLVLACALVSMSACASASMRHTSRASELHAGARDSAYDEDEEDVRGDEDEDEDEEDAVAEPLPDTKEPPTLSREERERFDHVQRFVLAAARAHEIDASLINAVIWVESRFTPRARGHRGPRGLMQLMPRTARALARELHRKYEPYSADFNIDVGAFYLSRMIAQFDGDVALGLAAYNAGPARIRSARESGEPISGQTQHYVRSVLAAQPAFSENGD